MVVQQLVCLLRQFDFRVTRVEAQVHIFSGGTGENRGDTWSARIR